MDRNDPSPDPYITREPDTSYDDLMDRLADELQAWSEEDVADLVNAIEKGWLRPDRIPNLGGIHDE